METPEIPSTETATAEPVPARPATGRTLAVIIASALLGALVGGGVVFLSMAKPSTPKKPPASASKAPNSPSAPTTGPKEAAAGSEWSSPLTSARQMVAAGRLREAQEEYLSILLIEPTHEEAMRGLVRVVGLIAKGNRAALQRQAEEYRQAVALGIETEEHYTAPAMELLARATLEAAGGRMKPAPRTPLPAPTASTTPQSQAGPPAEQRSRAPSRTQSSTGSTKPQPEPRPGRAQTPVPNPGSTPQTPRATTSQSPETTPEAAGPLVLLQIGPVPNPLATEILGELTLAGFSARVSSQGGLQVFRVLSNRLPAAMASRRASELTAAGFPARVRLLSGGFAQLDLGVYPTAEGAEATAGKVRANGVDASVVPEGGPSRVITVGPHPQTMVDEIARSLRAKFRTVRLVVTRAE